MLTLDSVPTPLEGTPLFAHVAGDLDRPLVLLLHGFPDVPRSWEGVATKLVASGYRVVAPYQPGYHPSPPPTRGEGDAVAIAGVYADWLARQPRGRGRFVVGHDWGAVVAYALAAVHPEAADAISVMAVPHIRAFVLNALRYPRQIVRSRYMAQFQFGPLSDAMVRARDFAFVRALWRRWSPFFEPEEAYWEDLFSCLRASHPAPLDWYRRRGTLGLAFGEGRRRARQLENEITLPTLYLHGARDGCVGQEITRGQARYYRGPFEEEVLPGCGHFLQIERPDAVAERVVDFFRRYAVTSGS